MEGFVELDKLIFFIRKEKNFCLIIIALSILTFAITDFTSAAILKPLIGRMRTCHSDLGFALNNIAGCGGKFSMPSSHAANYFGLAAFWFRVIVHCFNKKWFWLWWWAFAVCYAQVYVGVHYPGDVLAGAILSIGTGNLTFLLFIEWTTHINIKRNIQKRMVQT